MPTRNARTIDMHSSDNEKTEHRVLDRERIRDKRTANIRGARKEAFGGGQIRVSEEVPYYPNLLTLMKLQMQVFLILCDFSQYHLNTVDIEKKFSHIGILRKNSHFPGFNMIPDVIYAPVLTTHLFLQMGFQC